jgi:23S rRNA pseudouridine2605 synthase
MSHPRFQVPRSYQVWTDAYPSRHDADALLSGIDIGEGETGRALEVLPGDGYFELVLAEGKNREIRRMMATLGLRILDLNRVSFGPVRLENLKPGEYREIAKPEFSTPSFLGEKT